MDRGLPDGAEAAGYGWQLLLGLDLSLKWSPAGIGAGTYSVHYLRE